MDITKPSPHTHTVTHTYPNGTAESFTVTHDHPYDKSHTLADTSYHPEAAYKTEQLQGRDDV